MEAFGARFISLKLCFVSKTIEKSDMRGCSQKFTISFINFSLKSIETSAILGKT